MGIGSNNERVADGTGAHEAIGNSQSVDESGTYCLKIEGWASSHAETCLQAASGRRIDAIRGRSPHNDEIEMFRIEVGCIESSARRPFREIDRRFTFIDNMPSPDSGSFPYPAVGSIHEMFDVSVTECSLGQIGTGADDGAEVHTASRSASMAARCLLMRSGMFL